MFHRLAIAEMTCAFSLLVFSPTAAQTLETEHPLIRAFPGSKLKGESRIQESGEMNVSYRGEDGLVRKTLRGVYRYLEYEILTPGEAQDDDAPNDVVVHYEELAKQLQGTIHSKDSNRLIFSLPREDGGHTWCRLWASREDYSLEIVDEPGIEPVAAHEETNRPPDDVSSSTVAKDAEQMREMLRSAGRVAVPGLSFSEGRSTLMPGSGRALDELARLLSSERELQIEIQAFADPTTAPEDRLGLAVHRAETVVDALTLYGIDGSRLAAEGMVDAPEASGIVLALR